MRLAVHLSIFFFTCLHLFFFGGSTFSIDESSCVDVVDKLGGAVGALHLHLVLFDGLWKLPLLSAMSSWRLRCMDVVAANFCDGVICIHMSQNLHPTINNLTIRISYHKLHYLYFMITYNLYLS